MSAWFKFRAKNPTHSGVCVQGEWQKHTCLFLPFSTDKVLKCTGHSISIGNLILGVNSVTVSCFIYYDTLLQNMTDIITKCDSYFLTKCDRSLSQNASGVLLQNVTVIKKCDIYYKLQQYITVFWKLNGLFVITRSIKLGFSTLL